MPCTKQGMKERGGGSTTALLEVVGQHAGAIKQIDPDSNGRQVEQ